MKATRIYIVEDNFFYANLLKTKIEKSSSAEIEIFSSVEKVSNNLHKQPEIIFLDYYLHTEKGLDLLKYIKSNFPQIHVVMISGQESISVAVESLKFGATDYFIKGKDDSNENIEKVIEDCERLPLSSPQEKKNLFGTLFSWTL